MPITTTSKDTLSDGTTSVSFSQMRDYYGITGPVSLSGSLNKSTITVPDTLPEAEEEISVSDFRTKNRILVKMGITDTITEGDSSSWAPRQQTQFNFTSILLAVGVLVVLQLLMAVEKKVALAAAQVGLHSDDIRPKN